MQFTIKIKFEQNTFFLNTHCFLPDTIVLPTADPQILGQSLWWQHVDGEHHVFLVYIHAAVGPIQPTRRYFSHNNDVIDLGQNIPIFNSGSRITTYVK